MELVNQSALGMGEEMSRADATEQQAMGIGPREQECWETAWVLKAPGIKGSV